MFLEWYVAILCTSVNLDNIILHTYHSKNIILLFSSHFKLYYLQLLSSFLKLFYISNYIYFQFTIYRVSQEEWTKLRESVPRVKLYRYNPKHLYPKLNGYGDNG